MKRAPVVHHGRPLYSRKERGYAGDIANLARLRTALLSDMRFSTRSYQTAAHHIQCITAMIAPYKKGKPVRVSRKRK